MLKYLRIKFENKYTDFGFSLVDQKIINLVKNLFENVSFNYDLMNDFMSLKFIESERFMLDWLAPRKGQSLIDVAGGTGDISLDFIKRAKSDVNVTVLIFQNL